MQLFFGSSAEFGRFPSQLFQFSNQERRREGVEVADSAVVMSPTQIVEGAVRAKSLTAARCVQVELLGSEALELLSALIGAETLTEKHFVNATRLLMVLARHDCNRRKPFVIRLMMPFADDARAPIRARAAFVLVAEFSLWRAFRALPPSRPVDIEGVEREAAPCLERAVSLGLPAKEAALAKEFLARVR